MTTPQKPESEVPSAEQALWIRLNVALLAEQFRPEQRGHFGVPELIEFATNVAAQAVEAATRTLVEKHKRLKADMVDMDNDFSKARQQIDQLKVRIADLEKGGAH